MVNHAAVRPHETGGGWMRRKHWVTAVAALACTGLAVWAAVAAAAPERKAATKVTLQLKWVTQAQFAGYYAALEKNGIDHASSSDVTIVNQPFNMDLFLKRQVDAAAAMTYNELAQVLETKNPKTGQLYKLSDLNVFKMADPKVGTGMLEDN